MSHRRRLEKLESEAEAEAPERADVEAYQTRWREAYAEIAVTMSDEHFAEAHAAIIQYFERGGGVVEYAPTFLAAQILSLLNRAASGRPALLKMPPALASLWIQFERDVGEIETYERHALFRGSSCAECGAGYPVLRPFRWSREARASVGPAKDYASECVLCGGVVCRSWERRAVVASEGLIG